MVAFDKKWTFSVEEITVVNVIYERWFIIDNFSGVLKLTKKTI